MNKPNKTELEYFIRYSLDSDKYKRYMELYDEIERLNNIIEELKKDSEAFKKFNAWVVNRIEPDWFHKFDLIKKLEELKGDDKE